MVGSRLVLLQSLLPLLFYSVLKKVPASKFIRFPNWINIDDRNLEVRTYRKSLFEPSSGARFVTDNKRNTLPGDLFKSRIAGKDKLSEFIAGIWYHFVERSGIAMMAIVVDNIPETVK